MKADLVREARRPSIRDNNSKAVERYRDSNLAQYLCTKAKRRALVKGIKFKITASDVHIPTHCPVLGIPLFRGGRINHNSPTIDRIDNSKGYTRKNILVISWRANVLKRDATMEELMLMAKFYGAGS